MSYKKEEMIEIGKFFINEIAYDGLDPVKKYITKDKRSVAQNAESKMILMKCLKTAKRMKTKGAPREELLRIVTYAYILLETEEYTLDIKKAKADFGIDELIKKYAA